MVDSSTSEIISSASILVSIFGKLAFLFLSLLILVFLMITIKQINNINKQDDFCIRGPLVSIAKIWIYITITLAIIVILFI